MACVSLASQAVMTLRCDLVILYCSSSLRGVCLGAFAYDVSSRGGGGFEMLTVADEGGGGFEPC